MFVMKDLINVFYLVKGFVGNYFFEGRSYVIMVFVIYCFFKGLGVFNGSNCF